MFNRHHARRALWALAICAVASTCGEALPTPVPDARVPRCGDGLVDDGEECDSAAANSDTAANACRTTCRKPWCGDHAQDQGEACDDGNAWGGDGCTPICTAETQPIEKEPNDNPAMANPWIGPRLEKASGVPSVVGFSSRWRLR